VRDLRTEMIEVHQPGHDRSSFSSFATGQHVLYEYLAGGDDTRVINQ
jgi:hypothetical protein